MEREREEGTGNRNAIRLGNMQTPKMDEERTGL
jgi:hypothetical protein